jgi:acetyl esterase/lipase
MSEPRLDFYAPEGKGFPNVVHVYGSGWRTGSGKSSAPVAEALRRHGVGCVLVSHRLAPAHSIREQAGDVAAAFAWAKAHVAEKGGDPYTSAFLRFITGDKPPSATPLGQ